MKLCRKGWLLIVIIYFIVELQAINMRNKPGQNNKARTKLKKTIDNKVNDIVSYKYDSINQQYVLLLNQIAANQSLLKNENNSRNMSFKCSYRSLAKNSSGLYNIINPAVEVLIKDGDVVPNNVEAIITTCKSKSDKLLQVKPFIFMQTKNQNILMKTRKNQPNVVLFGFNGMTEEYFQSILKEIHGSKKTLYEMNKYGRNGENENQNLIAFLFGYGQSTQEILNSNHSSRYILKRFKNKGYLTAFAEDIKLTNNFPFEFQKQPADFYLGPLLKAIADNVPLQNETHNLPQGLSSNFVFDYGHQFFKRYLHSSQPFFGFFWTSTSEIQQNKRNFVEYIKRFKKLGLFRESIVIFFSDHVCKPMLFFWLPISIRKRYPGIIQNLTKNKNRVTSPFDLYLTLQNILELGGKITQNRTQPVGCPTCRSLFEELPVNRTCQEAGISENNCECANSVRLPQKDPLNLSLGTFLVKSLNQYLRNNQLMDRCEEFTLKSVESVYQIKTNFRSELDNYKVQFITQPKSSIFFATVEYTPVSRNIESAAVRSFHRFYKDASESKCVTMEEFKKVCLCKSEIIVPRTGDYVKLMINYLIHKVDDLEQSSLMKQEQIKNDIDRLKDMLDYLPRKSFTRTSSKDVTTEKPESDEAHVNAELSLHF
ncbi:uncharacterized protein LOC108040775 [Drosophila rhopaloa]|uniref:Uncharacterized protein LOC108040775 n=1 Tax=Drosophila rhopaloa TaxID=1041015 RepID=A0A6P4EKY4_DRORH|nr:uncharacterized protein LOC108040775 [Drosophila rhopaloa]